MHDGEEDYKNIYVSISLYDLRKMLKLPDTVNEMVNYLKCLKPLRYDYKIFDDLDKLIYKYKKYWE